VINGSVLLKPTATTKYEFECRDNESKTTVLDATVNIMQAVNPTNTATIPAQNSSVPASANRAAPSTSQAPRVPYENGTVQNEANSICAAYSGYQSVYSSPSAGGGSSVPVDLTALRPYLISIDMNSRLTANEMRQADLIRFCRILPNVAAASNRLAQDTAKQLKTIADTCVADEECLLERVFDSRIQKEVSRAMTYPLYGREIAQLVSNLKLELYNSPEDPDYDPDLQEFCNKEWEQKRNPSECWNIQTKGEIIKDAYYAAQNRTMKERVSLASEFAENGVAGSRTCEKTKNGTDPTDVKWYDENCVKVKKQPALINQEILKQITSLPFTQAYSPASELGADQNIGNISTRIRNGNLIDPDISSNFGSISSGGSNPLGGGIGGNVTNATDMKGAEANYKKILTNLQVITTLYDVARAAYASSTSVCRMIPVESRALTIQRVESAKKTYTDYGTELTKQWEAAVKTPGENHLQLITQINFDLKDKYNQELINKVYDAVKALLQTCTNAASGKTS
jgi:hypothetical protein